MLAWHGCAETLAAYSRLLHTQHTLYTVRETIFRHHFCAAITIESWHDLTSSKSSYVHACNPLGLFAKENGVLRCEGGSG